MIRHLPYYSERKIEKDETYIEMIKDDPRRGLGVVGKSGFIEVFEAESADSYAECVIFDGNYRSDPIPLYYGSSINYDYKDGVYAEWISLKAINGWIKYRLHWVPGMQE